MYVRYLGIAKFFRPSVRKLKRLVVKTGETTIISGYLGTEVADYVSIISKVSRTMEIRSALHFLSRVSLMMADNVSLPPPRPRAALALTKATGPEGRA